MKGDTIREFEMEHRDLVEEFTSVKPGYFDTPSPLSASGLEQSEIDAIQVSDLTSTYEILLKYRDICNNEGFIEQHVEIFCDLANTVEEGIVEHIYENNIKVLIMGAGLPLYCIDVYTAPKKLS